MTENKHISTNEIEAYLNGEMTIKEVNLLENHINDCAFCNDALEGMEMMAVPKITNQLKYTLKSKIEKRIRNNPTKMLMPVGQLIGIAASLLVIFTISFFVLNKTISTKKESKTIENVVTLPDIALKTDSVIKVVKASKLATAFPVTRPVFEIKTPVIGTTQIEISKSKVLAEVVTLKEIIEEKVDIVVNDDEQLSRELKKSDSESKIFQQENTQLISGFVSTKKGEVLPGASVAIKGLNSISSTDANGNFVLKNIKVGQTLIVSHIGMVPEEIKVQRENQTFKVQLEDDTKALSEVVVVGELDTRPDRMIEPVMGWTEFKKYIKSNIVYPESMVLNKIKGKVIVNLEVSNNGTVEATSITRKLGFGCEEESLRLLKDVQWLPAFQEGEKVRSTIRIGIKFGN